MKLERISHSTRPPGGDDARIVIFGDSHVHALQEALKWRTDRAVGVSIEARRLLKTKSESGEAFVEPALRRCLRHFIAWLVQRGTPAVEETKPRTLGDTTFAQFLGIARAMGQRDILVSAVGGNQHAVYSTIQHPTPFDFYFPEEEPAAREGVEVIPFGPLYRHFEEGLRNGDGATLAALKASTHARVVHLMAPPPKRNSDFIRRNHDTHFVAEGIAELGVSSADLRMKFWRLQNRALAGICADLGIDFLSPPLAACDEDGFLAEAYYARDATHANAAYGDLVIGQLEQLGVEHAP